MNFKEACCDDEDEDECGENEEGNDDVAKMLKISVYPIWLPAASEHVTFRKGTLFNWQVSVCGSRNSNAFVILCRLHCFDLLSIYFMYISFRIKLEF